MNDRKSENIFSIILANWVHIIGFYFSMYLWFVLSMLIQGTTSSPWYEILSLSISYSALLFIIYYPHLIIAFYILVVVLDFVGFYMTRWETKVILAIEWFVITIFFYWITSFEFWIFLTLTTSLLLTQWYKKILINRICKNNNRFVNEVSNF